MEAEEGAETKETVTLGQEAAGVSKEMGLEGGASSTINSVEELLRAENGKCEVWASFDAAAETSTGFSAVFLPFLASSICCL